MESFSTPSICILRHHDRVKLAWGKVDTSVLNQGNALAGMLRELGMSGVTMELQAKLFNPHCLNRQVEIFMDSDQDAEALVSLLKDCPQFQMR